MKNKQKLRRSCAVIGLVLLCILPVLTLGASAAEAEPEAQAASWFESAEWIEPEVKALPGAEWYFNSIASRFDYGVPDMLYAFQSQDWLTGSYTAEWLLNYSERFGSGINEYFDETVFVGSGVFGFYRDVGDGNPGRSCFPANLFLEFGRSECIGAYSQPYAEIYFRLRAYSPTEDREVEVNIVFHENINDGVYSLDYQFSNLYGYYNGNTYATYKFGGGFPSISFFMAMDLNSSLLSGHVITDVRQFMPMFADTETVDDILFFPSAYQSGFYAGYDQGNQEGYDIGYGDGSQDGFYDGRNVGYSEGYDSGTDYQRRYMKWNLINTILYSRGESLLPDTAIDAIDSLYSESYEHYYQEYCMMVLQQGVNQGLTDGMNVKTSTVDLIYKIFDAPGHLIDGILDFELFGINFAKTIKTVLTLAVFGVILFVIIKFVIK